MEARLGYRVANLGFCRSLVALCSGVTQIELAVYNCSTSIFHYRACAIKRGPLCCTAAETIVLC